MEERCIHIQVYASLSRRLDCAAQWVNNDIYRYRNNHYKTITIKEYFNNSIAVATHRLHHRASLCSLHV